MSLNRVEVRLGLGTGFGLLMLMQFCLTLVNHVKHYVLSIDKRYLDSILK